MAKSLNKTRIRDTKLALILCFSSVLLTKQVIGHSSPFHETFDIIGSILVSLCVAGRIYCTAFLGGQKNERIVDYGPFSVTRNPLYFCSFIGACGIGLMSNHLILMLLVPGLFCLIFLGVVRREEAYLGEKFGAAYAEYCAKVPRFWPRPSRYHAPETVAMAPATLLHAARDGMAWFLAWPFYELVEYLHRAEIIRPFFTLY